MKIYIHTDLEGICGIDCPEMIQRDNERREYSIQRLMADLNAAIDGAFQGGATHVTVLTAMEAEVTSTFLFWTDVLMWIREKTRNGGENSITVMMVLFHRRSCHGRDNERFPGPYAKQHKVV